MQNTPTNFKYTKEHEWAELKGKSVTIGITDHAQSALGDIVFLELPSVGRALKRGETFGVVESIKAVSDLYSPVEGKVVEVNASLAAEPATLNKSPYDAWLIRVELAGEAPADLMDAAAYDKYVKSLG